MAKILKECFLRPILNNHPPLRISTHQTMVGRSVETLIQDPNCSRSQVCLKAQLQEGNVLVKSVGLNPSVLNGKELKKNAAEEAVHGDTLELIPGLHKYTFEFKYETAPFKHEKTSDKGRDSNRARPNSSGIKNEIKKESSNRSSSTSKRARDEASTSASEVREGTSKRSKQEDSTPQQRDLKFEIKPTTEGVWESLDDKQLFIYTSAGVVSSEKIAAYDMDGTLIKTKSGNVFPKSCDDWQIMLSEIPGKLKSLHKNGFKLVIFTNQAGIGKGKIRIEDFRQKIEALVQKLNVPMQVFIATGSGRYRKPRTGMWNVLCTNKNDDVPVDLARSFYVGDAAGRTEIKKPIKRKKDHSSADRLLAMNVGIPFLTPEEHFQNLPAFPWTRPDFDPKDVFSSSSSPALLLPAGVRMTSTDQEVIVMVGYPGAGKSHFVRKHLVPKGYVVVNRDSLGSWQKCVVHMEQALKQGKSVVIDNMCPDMESRKRYVLIANRMKIPVRCFWMDVDFTHARHNNAFRELTDPSHTTIVEIVFFSYKSKFQEPTTQEGFHEIVKVKFLPKFDSEDHEKLYRMFLLEK